MSEDHVALLGSKGGPAIRPGSSMPTSLLVVLDGQRIVVDCGLGVTRGLCDQGMELRELSLIFITHLHSDHYLELGALLHTAWTAGLGTVVDVYGPKGLGRYWEHFVASMQDDINLRIADEGRPDLRELVRIHTLDAGEVIQAGGVTVRAIRTRHPPLVDCFALALCSATRHVVFSGDTAPLPALEDFARDADLLIHEAMLPAALPALVARVGNGTEKLMDHLRRSHSPAPDVGATAARAGVRALALCHLIPADNPSFTDADWRAALAGCWHRPLYIGRDGLRIPLGQ